MSQMTQAQMLASGTFDRGRKSYLWRDGAVICPSGVRGTWKAYWADRTPLRGEDPQTGEEVDWFFKSAEEAAQALFDGGEGPGVDNPALFIGAGI